MTRATIKKRTIAVDVDDVIAAHLEDFVAYSNQQFGTNLTEASYTNDWPTLWGISHEEMRERSQQYHQASMSSYAVIKDAQPVLKRLAEHFELVVATARPAYSVETTQEWLNQHFEGVFTDVHFIPAWEKGSIATKADLCKQIGAEYLIDDSPEHCNVAVEAGITTLLFGGYEWVKGMTVHPDVIAIDNWPAVEAFFRNA